VPNRERTRHSSKLGAENAAGFVYEDDDGDEAG
jgi:hypothetical protein